MLLELGKVESVDFKCVELDNGGCGFVDIEYTVRTYRLVAGFFER